MTEHSHHAHHLDNDHTKSPEHCPPSRWRLTYWIMGIVSLVWFLLRSGTKPKRLAYPCQRVAAVNSLGFLTYLASLLGSANLLRRLKNNFSLGRLSLLVTGLLLTTFLQSSITTPATPLLAASPDLPGWTHPDAVSDVFAITNVPEPLYTLDGGDIPGGIEPDEALHDDGVNALVNLMEAHGDYFYKTSAHPDGIFGSNDVIVIKINNQWDGRNGTNSDALKGVIYRLVQHPDGFTGAVIVAENTQNHNDDWYHQPSGNNSQFQDQSYQEVVQAFASEGYQVCISDWKVFRTNLVDDYDAGNTTDGYVLDDADDKLSYPKFQINCNGTDLRISMRKGLWNGSSFDNTRLKMINMPVLKRHGCAWATIAVKNYLGFITTYGSRWDGVSEMHCWLLGPSDNGYTCTSASEEYGLIARQMAHIRRADLNIVDAIWVNPRDNASWHGAALRQDVLLASRDPFAVDYYASDFVLYPLVEQYGDTSTPEHAMASHHGGWFRNIQMRNVARLHAEGITDVINMEDSMSRQEELNQFNVYVIDANEAPLPEQNSFEDSFKTVSHIILEGGETITYTIVLYEEASATLTLTDTIPSPLTYESGSVHVEPAWKNLAQYTGGDIRWSDAVTSTVSVTITFRAQVPITTTTMAITNIAEVSRDGAAPIERRAVSILNPFRAYLPLVFKNYQ